MMTTSSIKPKGDISSVFSHLGGKGIGLDPSFLTLKQEIAPKDPAILNNAYQRLLTSFQKESVEIKEKGSSVIPQVSFADIQSNGGQFPPSIAEEIRKRGCVVIRNVVSREEAQGYKQQIKEYIGQHAKDLGGFPTNDPQVWEVYWSRSQVAARSHPNFNTATLALNKIWHAEENTVIDLEKNLGYCDRLRIRKAHDQSFALQEHIDSGSLERWLDPEYRKCYTEIFNGNWENHDSFDATHRVEARMDYYNSPGGCSVFRNFQGWLAMSDIKTGGGTLRVCPLLKQSTAYFLMKPLIEENLLKNDYIGALPGLCQGIGKTDYPEIVDTMVSMPDVGYGDAVFWHCDQVHAVEPKNDSDVDSSVLYIPSVPLCRINSEYLAIQRNAFERGLTPPDFPGNHYEETFEDRAQVNSMNAAEQLNMGITTYPPLSDDATTGQKKALDTHNKALGFA
ncbi:hypothetical protein INT47_012529 [Mucor saturninus]|uniref:DUF1479-domain-containing protein n=1 Tax=Mucor saturninus TaxID=64648 RepID=A0A8H7V0F4_9FUNG|nr:hypothetical protein INT47_012529 [Mucor saturninus]